MVTIWNAMRSKSRIPAAVQACHIPCNDQRIDPSVTARIAAFLDGRTNGEDLLHELYDYVLDEPVPENMRALLRKS